MIVISFTHDLKTKLVLFVFLSLISSYINADYSNQRITICSSSSCPPDLETSSCRDSAHEFMPVCNSQIGSCFFVKGYAFNDPNDPTHCSAYFYNVHRLRINGIAYEKNRGFCPQCIYEGSVHPGTGNNFQTQADYQSSMPGGLEFKRYYNSTGGGNITEFGGSWRANYWQSIELKFHDLAYVYRPDGKRYDYDDLNDPNDEWRGDNDVVERLQAIMNGSTRTGWRYTLKDDTVEEYDVNGKLISITNRASQVQTLTYDLSSANGGDDDPATLDQVTGPFGRKLSFSYDSNGKLVTFTDPDNQEYHYTYHSTGNIETVTYPDETPLDNTDNPVRTYHYENLDDFPTHLTGITDETGKRVASWEYDFWGRTIVSERGGGAERLQFSYNSDISTTVTDEQGRSQTYHLSKQHNYFQATQIDNGPCSNCGEQFKNTSFDGNGFVSSRTDFNGNTTTFTHDSNGLETSRTEAVGTPQERIITTEWHPTFRLPTKITEPGKVTTFTYDTQGRLLDRKESSI